MAQRIVGLDIGTSAIRAVELTVDTGGLPILEAFGQVGLPPGAVVNGEVRDRSQVVQGLQRVWHEGGFKERRVVLGVAGLRAITRELDMPPLNPDELDDAVRFQADQVVPFPMDQTAISSKVIAQFTDEDGAPQIRVLVAAAHRELIDGVVGVVQEAGLEPVGIDLDTAALARALNDPGYAEGAEVVVSVGAGLTMVVVHQKGQLQFVRTIDLGGASITQAIAGAMDLPLVDAEQIKRRMSNGEQHDDRAADAIEAAVSDLVGEIHNSVRFYASLPGREVPTRMLVTGAGSKTAGFLSQLQTGLDIPVAPASPLSRIDTSRLPISAEQAAAIDPTLAVPIGLALPDPSGKPFNLLPPEITTQYAEKRVKKVLIASVAVLTLLLVVGTVWRVLAVHSAENAVASLTSQLAYINNTEIPKYDKVVAIQQQVKTLQDHYVPLVSNEVDWLVVLNQLGQYLPSTAVFSTLSLAASTLPTRVTSSAASSGSSSSGSSSSGSGSSSSSTSSGTPSTSAVIGTGSGSVTVANYTAFSQFGDSMAQSPVITLGAPSGTLTNGSSITFKITFNIGSAAAGHRASQFTKAST